MYLDSSRIAVGADTQVNRKGQVPLFACKIKNLSSVYVAISGFTKEPREGFEAYSLAAKAIKQSNGTIESADLFAKIAIGPFRQAVRNERRIDRRYYERVIRRGPAALSVLFMKVEGAVPTIALVTFTLSEDSHQRIVVASRVESCPGDKCPPLGIGIGVVEPTFLALGENEAAIAASKSQSFVPSLQRDPVPIIRKLIQSEASAHDDVGGAIDILTITREGVKTNQKGECP